MGNNVSGYSAMGASTLSNCASEYCCVDAEVWVKPVLDCAKAGSAAVLESAKSTDKVMLFIHSPYIAIRRLRPLFTRNVVSLYTL